MFVLFPNGAKAWYALTRFSKRFEGLGPRVVAKEDKFIYRFSERPLRKKCRGAMRRRAMFRASGCPPQQRQNKKRTPYASFFGAPLDKMDE